MTCADNPFAAFGTLAIGPRFLGRADAIEDILVRVGTGLSSAAIIGLPRIGKSSLAGAVLERLGPDASVQTDWLSVASFDSGAQLFDALQSCLTGAPPLGDVQLSTTFMLCKRALLGLARDCVRVVIVFDEFDAVRHWSDGARTLNCLRELIYNPSRLPLAGIFVSRRALDRLEIEMTGISTFAGVVQSFFVGALAAEDIDAMACRHPRTADQSARVYEKVAGHPFLSEQLLNGHLTSQVPDINQYYEQVANFLQDENLEARLVWLTSAGASPPADPVADALLLSYGLWRDDGPGYGLTDFMRHRALDLNLWEEFGQAERSVRALLDSRLGARLGRSWFELLPERNSKGGMSPLVKGAQERRDGDAAKWDKAASRHLLDYTYPDDLMSIINVEWEALDLPTRYRDKAFWRTRITGMSQVRAPLAHAREDVLSASQVSLVRYQCSELTDAVAQILQSNSAPPT